LGDRPQFQLTSANNPVPFPGDLPGQFPSLTVSIYNLATYPDEQSRNLAWGASFILTIMVLIINLAGRYLTRHKK